MYNFDNPTSLIKYKYKYPVFNYKLINSLGTELKTLNVFNTKYVCINMNYKKNISDLASYSYFF